MSMIPFDQIVPRVLGSSRRELALLLEKELGGNPLLIEGHLCLMRHLQRLVLTERKPGFGAQVLARLDGAGFFRATDGRTIEDLARDAELGPESSLDAMWLLQEFAEELRALEPLQWGDAAHSGRDAPDAYVKNEGGRLVARYDQRGLLLRLDELRSRVTPKDPDDEVASWLPRAQWVIRSLEKRKMLLTRLLCWLVVEEREAFEMGPSFVKGAGWRDAADMLGVNVEAVFLVVAYKRVRTPRGTVQLGSFFET
jgi:DNA-directed RNA polymerase specialized sigma54-like protein